MTNNNIVVCVSTNFQTRQEIAAALKEQYGADYVFVGQLFQATTTSESCVIHISDRPPELGENFDIYTANTFDYLKPDYLTTRSINPTNNCPQNVYLISLEVGYDACVQIARFVQVFLSIGGICVKVESAGISHSADKWLANYNSTDVFDIYSLYVGLVEGDDCYYSCGMSNFGKADVAVDISEDVGLAIYVMNVFNYYRLTESPILQDGHTFQPDIECPIYRLQWHQIDDEETDNWLHNPHGRWHLNRI